MSANPGLSGPPQTVPFPGSLGSNRSDAFKEDARAKTRGTLTLIAGHRLWRTLSPWSRSMTKRWFDSTSILLALPIIVPAFLTIGFAVRITSRGPVLFRQQRMGRNGRVFTILKFRTMPIRRNAVDRPTVTTSSNQRFTPIGPFLRRWKLDELPQLVNVLRGDMSLVGPRPKLPKHQTAYLHCRPGLTGGATIVFAREEVTLSTVPSSHLDIYYHSVVLPAKQLLDDEYMAQATFASDLKLILKSLFRNWDELALTDLPSIQHIVAQFTANRKNAEWATTEHSTPSAFPSQNIPATSER